MNIITHFFSGLQSIIKFTFNSLKYLFTSLINLIILIPKYIITGLKYLFKKNKNQPDALDNKFIPIIITTLSIITYLICVFILTRWYVQSERTKNFTNNLNEMAPILNQEDITKDTPDQYEDLTNTVEQEKNTNNDNSNSNNNSNSSNNNNTPNSSPNYINVNLNYYLSKNSETVAWLQVNGTKVNYPVVQHDDNSYYLEHDFYKRKTAVGWIFADYRNNFETLNNNTIIYGHNLINKTMFGTIPNLLKKNWFNTPNRNYIKLSTKTTNSIWQIFSVYSIEPTTDYLQVRFNSTTVYQSFLDIIKNRSEQKFDIDVTYTDKIITLSTCDNTGTKRVVVHAKLINIENK